MLNIINQTDTGFYLPYSGGTFDVEIEVDDLSVNISVTHNGEFLELLNKQVNDSTNTIVYTFHVPSNSSTDERTTPLLFFSDNGDNATIHIFQEGDPNVATIALYATQLSYSSTGGTNYIQVDYINAQTINTPYCSQSWVTIQETIRGYTTVDGYPVTQVKYAITMASTTYARQVTVKFSCVGLNGNVVEESNLVLKQGSPSQLPSITPTQRSFNISCNGASGYMYVEYEYFDKATGITPTVNADWLSITYMNVSSESSNYQKIRYRYTCKENTVSTPRTATITFSGKDIYDVARTATIVVNQEGADMPPTNYIGYFKSVDGVDYTVKLITDASVDDYGEIALAGDTPFLVNYQSSDILFEPIKKSTATIKIVHNTYLENILSPYSQGTKVELIAENKKKWVGFLTPKVYDQSWVTEWEEIELEASDCISALQYLDYEAMNDKGFVTFKDILKMIVEKTQLIKGYYWPQSKIVDDDYLTPEKIGVYEKNFFSNDTDEPWKLYDVLSEICQYLGLTCVQSFDELWFLDYGDYLTQTPTNSKYDYYTPSQIYRSYDYMGKYTPVITSKIFRGNDGSISFQPIYNKVTVKDNMYNVEDVFPNIFDDKYLTNINGDFFAAVEVEPLSEYASYPYGSSWFSQKYVDEEVADTAYRYFMRIYEHKYWQTVYNGNMTLMGGDAVQSLRNILQGRLVDLGTVKKTYYSYGQKIMPNTVDYKRYICIPTKHNDTTQNTGKVVYKLKDGWRMPCMVSNDSFLVFQNSVIFERYNGRPYINPKWTNKPNKIYLGLNGSSWDRIAWPMYRLTIGDKAWSGFHKKWVALDDARNYFEPVMEWQQDNMNYWNTEIECLNQVSWEENIKEAGYVIPLKDVDLSQPIHFEILCPAPSNYARDKDNNYMMMKYNAYCWISDLSVKIVERGQDVDKQDNDVVYENIIDENSMCEYNEVDFKLTTYSEDTKPSYSHVVYINGDKKEFLLTIKDRGLTSAEQNAEENFIERIVNQYSTPTQQLSITVSDKYEGGFTYNSIISPFKYNDAIYFPMGTEIDYAASREKITLIETK